MKAYRTRIRKAFGYSWFASTGNEDGDSLFVVALLIAPPSGGLLCARFGWGHDEDIPLRPWPAMAIVRTNHGPDLCVGLFGFYVGLTVSLDGAKDAAYLRRQA